MTPASPMEYRRAGWFTLLLVLINLVGDGWSGRPVGLMHQVVLLPALILFIAGAYTFLFRDTAVFEPTLWSPIRAVRLALGFEIVAAILFLYECKHFANLGYHFYPVAVAAIFGILLMMLGWAAVAHNGNASRVFGISVACYLGGMLLAIASFPLNYLRSDMLPVILWADTNLLHHVSPYATMFVGGRVYDFPYLPGMLVAYLPFVATHLDVRFGAMFYVAASAALIFKIARRGRQLEVATLVALFILCPFLQYRHELYIQPHWLMLVLAFVLMQKRRFVWAAIVFGIGAATYQFSWILLPFFLLNALRRKGWLEVAKLASLTVLGAAAIAGPFLASAIKRIASNTVGQWQKAPHALADPMNLSYWVTYLIRPDKLLWVQAILMVAIFIYCLVGNRCMDLADTLRWMIVALTIFILLNVLVDGYFYLMLLVPMLVFTCVANGWWREPEDSALV